MSGQEDENREAIAHRLRLMRDTLAEDIAIALCSAPDCNLEGMVRGDTDQDHPLTVGRHVAAELLGDTQPKETLP